jgi:hypothetical protein
MNAQINSKYTCVLKTGRLHEHDMAANALSEHGIPYFKQEESVSGLKLAMPFQPSMGPGTYFNIMVPDQFIEEAKSILENLPIDLTTNPDLFHFGAGDTAKKRWRIVAWFFLVLNLVFLVATIIDSIK